jgi:membrane protein
MDWRWADFDYDPTHWVAAVVRVAGRSWRRTQNRNAALYVGGVCFYGMLAIFPSLALLIGLYSLLFTPAEAQHQAQAMAHLLPPGGPRALFTQELSRLAHAPIRVVSMQSFLAAFVAFYAAHRGVKALIAGLNLIHGEPRPRGLIGFNVLALAVAIGGFALVLLISVAFVTVRVAYATLELHPSDHPVVFSEWTWAGLGLVIGWTLSYRYVMASKPLPWRAALAGGATASALNLASSWFGAFYIQQFTHFGATYGSVTGVVVFLVWLSWNVNSVFYGGAVATEMEILASRRSAAQQQLLRERKARMVSSQPGS